jgi:hypothetical protein
MIMVACSIQCSTAGLNQLQGVVLAVFQRVTNTGCPYRLAWLGLVLMLSDTALA